MSTYFTITGHHTKQRWLINIYATGAALIEPNFWDVREHQGLSYVAQAARRYSMAWLPWLMLRIRARIWWIERRWARKARRQANIERLAARHGGKPAAEEHQ